MPSLSLAPVFDIFKEEYINIAGSALTHLTTYLNQHIQTYLSSTPFQPGFLQAPSEEMGIEVEVRVEVPNRAYIGKISRGRGGNILHDILALISEFEQGNWRAKIFISHLQSDYLWGQRGRASWATLVEDATAWDHCVYGFQNQLHDHQKHFGVSYRGRKGHEVVVKTVVDEGHNVRQEKPPLEILLFWWNDSMTGVQMRPGYLLRNVEEVP